MKLAIVASGWHFPLDFYESVSRQIRIKDWQYDMFCISHRDPKYSKHEKKDLQLQELDAILYKEIATIEQIKSLGWDYKEYPVTIGTGVVQINGWKITTTRIMICYYLPMMTISFIITNGLGILYTLSMMTGRFFPIHVVILQAGFVVRASFLSLHYLIK